MHLDFTKSQGIPRDIFFLDSISSRSWCFWAIKRMEERVCCSARPGQFRKIMNVHFLALHFGLPASNDFRNDISTATKHKGERSESLNWPKSSWTASRVCVYLPKKQETWTLWWENTLWWKSRLYMIYTWYMFWFNFFHYSLCMLGNVVTLIQCCYSLSSSKMSPLLAQHLRGMSDSSLPKGCSIWRQTNSMPIRPQKNSSLSFYFQVPSNLLVPVTQQSNG